MIIISYNDKMRPTNLLLIGLIILVLLLVHHFMGRNQAAIEIPVKSVELKSKPKPKSIPPPRRVEVHLNSANVSTTEVIMLRTKEDLVKEIEKVVDTKIEERNEMANEIVKMESREIHNQEEKTEIIKAETEEVLKEKMREIVNATSAIEELMQKRRNEFLKKKKKKQEDEATLLLIQKERTATENAKKLADIRLTRRNALKKMEEAEKSKSQLEVKTREQELLRLEEARADVEAKKVELEAESKNLKEQVDSDNRQSEIDEALFQEEKVKLLEEHKKLETEYIKLEAERLEKIKEAEAELNELLESEKKRQVQMEADDEILRQIETQKLLKANEDALKELEEAEAEQGRMDAEDVEMRRQFESESAIAENAQRASTSQSQAEYDAKIASDQALFDTQVSESERTGDAEQRAERQAATDLESQSLEDFNKLTEEEKERERVAATKLAEDSKAGGTTVPEGDNSSLNFDYDAYMRGEAIPCAVEPWGEWKKFGSLIEETETIVSGRMNREREIPTGRWSQRWKRERKEIRPALNGGRCTLEELKFTSQASKGCSESDWNPWKNAGDPYKQKRGNQWKWYVNQERDRATAVVADGCNLRTDAKRTELPAQSCRYSGWSAYRNITGAYEQTKSVRVGRGSVNKKTGKWVVKQEATRSILEQAKYGGTPCSNTNLTSTREVVLAPQNCIMKGWGSRYSISDRIDRVCRSLGLRRGRSCTETHYARQKRTRGVHRPAAYGGAGCGTSEEVSETKRDPITCVRSWGAWYNHGSQRCTPGRGRGRARIPRKCSTPQRRDATISRHPQYGAPACGSLTQTRAG